MASDPIIFAGVEFSSGRKPITFAALDEALKVRVLERWDSAEVVSSLQNHENCSLGINLPTSKRGQEIHADLKEKLVQAGFKPFSHVNNPRQWIETNSQDCFRAFGGHHLLSQRPLEGRLQRTAILYEQGLQVNDPVDMFEEITRYKLIQGILPLENLPSAKELDALVSAYIAWMSVNRPGQIVPRGDFVLPVRE
jgi:hypothetical protein